MKLIAHCSAFNWFSQQFSLHPSVVCSSVMQSMKRNGILNILSLHIVIGAIIVIIVYNIYRTHLPSRELILLTVKTCVAKAWRSLFLWGVAVQKSSETCNLPTSLRWWHYSEHDQCNLSGVDLQRIVLPVSYLLRNTQMGIDLRATHETRDQLRNCKDL